jgi:hypothetical protein
VCGRCRGKSQHGVDSSLERLSRNVHRRARFRPTSPIWFFPFGTRFLLDRSASPKMVLSGAALQPTRSLSQGTKGRIWARSAFKESRLQTSASRLPFERECGLGTTPKTFLGAQARKKWGLPAHHAPTPRPRPTVRCSEHFYFRVIYQIG